MLPGIMIGGITTMGVTNIVLIETPGMIEATAGIMPGIGIILILMGDMHMGTITMTTTTTIMAIIIAQDIRFCRRMARA